MGVNHANMICLRCENSIAGQECVQCNKSFCQQCFMITHRKGDKRKHRFHPNSSIIYKCLATLPTETYSLKSMRSSFSKMLKS